jgi:hypothetical protein
MTHRFFASTVIASLALFFSFVGLAHANTHGFNAGGALARPGTSDQVQRVRKVWIWADYWQCALTSGHNVVTPSCTWVPSHYGLEPDYMKCGGVFLDNDPDQRVTVCLPKRMGQPL